MIVKKKFDVLLTQAQLADASGVIQQANEQDVTQIINVGTSLTESMNCVELARTFDPCYAAVGIHPNDCSTTWHEDLKTMKDHWFQKQDYKEFFKIVAIGEIGLDKHHPGYDIKCQIDSFKAQIEWALEYDLPVIIHTREAGTQTLQILKEYKGDKLRGVIHCFSEDQAFADRALELGFVLGIGGPLTYPKNDALREIFKRVPLEKIILETDAPFLPPQSIRGKQNSPKYIKEIAEFLANLRDIPFKEVADVTTNTAKTLFEL